jgi:WD40 repeat protein
VTPTLSRDGKYFAAVGDRSTKVWRVNAPEPQFAWEVPRAQFFSFAPDNEHALYSDSADGMRLVRISDGAVLRTIGRGAAHSRFAFSADANRIAVCGAGGVQVIDRDTGKVDFELPTVKPVEARLAWHPSGEYLAVWGDDMGIGLWNVKTAVKVLTFLHPGKPAQLSFNSDGSVFVSQSLWDHRLCVWEVGTGQRLLEVPEFDSHACDAVPDRRIVILTIRGADSVLTEITPGTCRPLAQSLYAPLGYWHKASVSPEGRIVAFSSTQGLEVWDLQTARRVLVWKIGSCMAEFDRTGRLFIGCNSGVYRLPRHVETIASPVGSAGAAAKSANRKTIIHFGAVERLTGAMVPTSLAVNASGETLVFQDEHGWALKHSDKEEKVDRLQTSQDARKSAVSDDNRFAAVANWQNGGATVWDAQSGNRLTDLAVGYCGVPQFSPDGRLLAITPDGVTIWSTSDWRRINQLHAQGTTPSGLGLAFSPDSRVLVVGHVNGALSLVDPLTGNEWARISRSDLSTTPVMAFSPDQRWLVTSSRDEGSPPQVWDLVTMRRELSNRGLDLPADVLRPAANSQAFEEQLEVVLDEAGLIESSLLPGTQESSTPAQ